MGLVRMSSVPDCQPIVLHEVQPAHGVGAQGADGGGGCCVILVIEACSKSHV